MWRGSILRACLVLAALFGSTPSHAQQWTGPYGGLNFGRAFAGSQLQLSGTRMPFIAPFLSDAANSELSGDISTWMWGAQFGYNRRISDRFVAGFEADLQQSLGTPARTKNITINDVLPGWLINLSYRGTKTIDFLGTVRGRFGYLYRPDLLLFGTGGLAYGHVGLSGSWYMDRTNLPPPNFGEVGAGATLYGWTLGAGFEWMLRPNWSFKGEYLYFDLGRLTTPSIPYVNINDGSILSNNSASTRFDGHLIRIGLNYQLFAQ